MEPTRRAALRVYFYEVVKDLVARGIVKRRNGESLESILRTELRTVLRAAGDDIGAIGAELGVTLAKFSSRALGHVVQSHIDGIVDTGKRAFEDWLRGRR